MRKNAENSVKMRKYTKKIGKMRENAEKCKLQFKPLVLKMT
jgi:hypothetical protein